MAPAAEQSSDLEIGELPALAIYDGSAERRNVDNADADLHSRLMLQALKLGNKGFEGAGAVRRMAAGHSFQLTQHENYGDGANLFTALWVEHEARNNFGPALDGAVKQLLAASWSRAPIATASPACATRSPSCRAPVPRASAAPRSDRRRR